MARRSVKQALTLARPDPWRILTRYTGARIGLGRAGGSIPTRPLLEFQLAHARARDAVQHDLDATTLEQHLRARGWEVLRVHSAAPDRRTFVQRPDLGRMLDADSTALLEARLQPRATYDAAFVIADGLSARAVEEHAVPLLGEIIPRLQTQAPAWRLAPVVLVEQGRVAVGDAIGALLSARLVAMLIGERPGLSSPASLGVYLTWNPAPGRSDAERNCISNIHPEGLSYELAAHKLYYLMTEARRRQLTGVSLKEEAPALPPAREGSVDGLLK